MRMILPLILSCLMLGPAWAEDGSVQDQSSAAVAVQPAKPLSDAEKRSLELDALFAQLHRPKLPDARNIEKKIWALWQRNDSPTAELLLSQAGVAMNDKAFGATESMLDTLLDTHPAYVEALNKRATLYFNLKRYDEAMADLEQVLAEEPRHFGAMAARGFIFSEQEKFGLAAQAFREALEINPNMEGVAAALKQLQHDYPDI